MGSDENWFLSEGLHIKNLILKHGAFKEDPTYLHLGEDNRCYLSDDIFHLWLDCDSIKQRQIFDGTDMMRKEFEMLADKKFFLISSSPLNWHVASFVYLTKKLYFEMLWYAVDIGLAHAGFAFYSYRKGYAVLRFGAKYGIVPRVMCSLGKNVCCKKDMELFLKDREWKYEERRGGDNRSIARTKN